MKRIEEVLKDYEILWPQTVYKIRNKQTGLYSLGGQNIIKFSENGKLYNMLSHIKAHINQHLWKIKVCNKNTFKYNESKEYLDNIEIVEFKINENKIININDLIKE